MIPENEQGVIVLFAEGAKEAEVEILAIQSAYPDALVLKDGKEWRVEFEFLSSNFVSHAHDPTKCDMIVCWQNDDEKNPMPTIELSDPGWKRAEWTKPTISDRNAAFWRLRALTAEKQLRELENNNTPVAEKTTQKRDQILLLGQVPDLPQSEIARILGASRSYVSEVLRDAE